MCMGEQTIGGEQLYKYKGRGISMLKGGNMYEKAGQQMDVLWQPQVLDFSDSSNLSVFFFCYSLKKVILIRTAFLFGKYPPCGRQRPCVGRGGSDWAVVSM